VDPGNDYIYDSIYRLIEATGREHLGQTNGTTNQPTASSPFDGFAGLPGPNDGNAMGTYIERYSYDGVRNILTLKHTGSDPTSPGWTRTYTYQELSQLQPALFNNRISSTTVGTVTQPYGYDSDAGLHGEITSMPQLTAMAWDSRDQLRSTAKQVVMNGGTPETTFYIYDMNGERVRKVTNYYASPGATASRKAQTVYIGGFEVYTRFSTSGPAMLVRDTVHIQGADQTMALVEREVKGGVATEITRYQFGNHIGSIALELDDSSQVISYEEYTPYGNSSYFTAAVQTATPKRYRYMAKERDFEETGFYYYGSRYYASWLGRWTNCDQAGYVDGLNPYVFVKSNPVCFTDSKGFQVLDPTRQKPDPKPDPTTNIVDPNDPFVKAWHERHDERPANQWLGSATQPIGGPTPNQPLGWQDHELAINLSKSSTLQGAVQYAYHAQVATGIHGRRVTFTRTDYISSRGLFNPLW
jgi:RHS repeat-associated protein